MTAKRTISPTCGALPLLPPRLDPWNVPHATCSALPDRNALSSHISATSSTILQSAVDSQRSTSISDLPNELLITIFEYFDTTAPSCSNNALRDEPIFELTYSTVQDLKNVSLISRRWRRIAMSLLFRNTQLCIPAELTSCRRLQSITLHLHSFQSFLVEQDLAAKVETFVLIIERDAILEDGSQIWDGLLHTIDPMEVTIVATASALGSLIGCHRDYLQTDTIDPQYLRLQRPSTSSILPMTCSTMEESNQVYGTKLLYLRPWSSLLLNEGSFIERSNYSEDNDDDANILHSSTLAGLLGSMQQRSCSHRSLMNPTIHHLAYISIFPPASHIGTLVSYFPRVDSIFVQLVPKRLPLSKIQLGDQDSEDLWMTRNVCYATLMRELFHTPPMDNFKYLQVFESGDAADRDGWEMAVAYVTSAMDGWKIAGEAVLVKNQESKKLENIGEDDETEGNVL